MQFSQQFIESEMHREGKVRESEKRSRFIRKEMETARPSVNRLMSGCIGEYAKGIDDWVRHASSKAGTRHTAVVHLKKLKPELIASMSARIILNSVSSQKAYTRLCVKIGEALEAEINFNSYKKKNPVHAERSRQRLMRTKVGYDFRKKCAYTTLKKVGHKIKYLTPTERLHIGAVCVELFIKHTGLVKVHKKWESPKRWVNIIVATDDCMNWINKFEESRFALYPRKYPSVGTPPQWKKGMALGGYTDLNVAYPLVKSRRQALVETLSHKINQKALDCINNIQSTPWRVNGWILDVMNQFWKNGLDDGKDMPMNKLLPIPPKPRAGASKDEIKDYSRKTAYAYSKNAEYRSQRVALAQIIYTAGKYKEQPKMYFPCQFDFRGRVYYVPEHLNPQGSDYAKALLEFAEGHSFEYHRDLIHIIKCGAGLFGVKGTAQECKQWVLDNKERIRKSVHEPYNYRWWQEAKDAWQFLRWCKEWEDIHNAPNHKTHYPVVLDCTASGLQILSLLTGDAQGAEHTNLVFREAPSDIYGKVLGELYIILKADSNPYARFWEHKQLDRKLTKPVCMTLPYGATLYGIRANIENWYREKHKELPSATDFWKCSMYLAKKYVEAIKKFIPKGIECMEWIQDVSIPIVKKNNPVCWMSPSGFIVGQPYMASQGVSVKTNLAGKLRYVLLQKELKDKVDRSKQITAVAPNYIHSLDASVLHLGLCNFNASVVAIHDCFGTHANFVSELVEKMKASMVNIFKEDQLLNFRNQLSQYNPGISLPNNFQKGSFDAGQIMGANHIFV